MFYILLTQQMSFGTETNHEMKSFKLFDLLTRCDDLKQLGDIPIVMSNYYFGESWFVFGAPSIGKRLPDIEPTPKPETLGQHMKIPLNSVRPNIDIIAIDVKDAGRIRQALGY